MEKKFTTIDKEEWEFLCPDVEYSKVFDFGVTHALKKISHLMRGFILISGSAVLAETQLTKRTTSSFTPNDIDVYLSENVIKGLLKYRYVDLFMLMLTEEVKDGGQVDVVDFTETPDDGAYQFLIGDTLTVTKIASFEVTHHTSFSPVKIQLIVVADNTFTINVHDFCCKILSHFDINICRGSYDIFKRTVSFPTDKYILKYIEQKKFYYELNMSSKNDMLDRIGKYRIRGFKHLGYWNKRDRMVHRLC